MRQDIATLISVLQWEFPALLLWGFSDQYHVDLSYLLAPVFLVCDVDGFDKAILEFSDLIPSDELQAEARTR